MNKSYKKTLDKMKCRGYAEVTENVKGGGMKFFREIPVEMIKNDIFNLEQEGFTLIWKEESVELWAEVSSC